MTTTIDKFPIAKLCVETLSRSNVTQDTIIHTVLVDENIRNVNREATKTSDLLFTVFLKDGQRFSLVGKQDENGYVWSTNAVKTVKKK